MTIQNPRLPSLNLDVQKDVRFIVRPFRLTQADKGYIQPFRLTNSWSAYDVSEINLNFAATKPDGQIIDIKKEPNRFKQENGIWLFYLPEEIAQAVGNVTAYFYVTDSSDTILATTTKFGYEVSARYGDDVKSNSYISEIEDMEKQFQEYLANAKAQVNAQNDLTNEYKEKLSQTLSEMSDKVATWLSTKTAAIDQDIKNRQDNLDRLNADYQAKYNELVASWQNKIAEINTDWEQRKAEIISEAKNQRTDISNEWESLKSKFKADRDSAISQANADFKAKLDTIQADWNNQKSKLEQEITDFKTNLENKVQVVTNKVSDLVTHTYPDLSSKTDAISTKIAQLKEEFSKIDFSTYATKEDLQKVQPDFSKIIVQNKTLDDKREIKIFSHHLIQNPDEGFWVVSLAEGDTVPRRVQKMDAAFPKMKEKIGNLQTTKADKSELSNYATKTDLNNKTERPLFETMLQNYATKNDLNNHQVDLSNYATKSDLDHKADRSDFSYYATKNELDIKADKSELSQYATKSDLASHQPDLSNYATKSDLDHKADRSDFSYYATKNELSNKADRSDLSSYATKDDLGSKADRSELSNYATTGDINSAIQNVRIKQDSLDSDNNYISKKVYSPEWSDGHLTFDMSDSYATYKTKSLASHMSAMQEQITQLQLEVKKKIVIPVNHGLSGSVYNTSDHKYYVKFFVPNIDLSVGQWLPFSFSWRSWQDGSGGREGSFIKNRFYGDQLVTFYDDYGNLKPSVKFRVSGNDYPRYTQDIPISIQDNFLIFDFAATGLILPRQTSEAAYYIERSK
ncbi:BppU family phage baseplate upper protein [Lactobacillus iners]|uniref:BppU family phage baseplate upper protein n=2 Tax=Lactobacillales TaxID=186826 RepID=UPI001F089AF3|nr:BppU family phage baseplate upper protein [Lactobacillus iners]